VKRETGAASHRVMTLRPWMLAIVMWASAPAALVFPWSVGAVEAAAPAPARGVIAVDSVGIPVRHLERSIAFYTQVLHFKVVADREVTGEAYAHLLGVPDPRLREVRLRLGGEYIELMRMITPLGSPLPANLHSNDFAFEHVAIVVSDMEHAYRVLRRHHVILVSSGPQVLPAWNAKVAGIAAVYFRDPDGNFLELLQFPRGKGAPKWQNRAALFLGIDHTAIVVRDTATSLAYYRGLLGFRVAGGSVNSGIEQERLSAVRGARVRITSLRVAQGPGIELLEYLVPRTGRVIPEDSRASDAWYWQVNMIAPALDRLYAQAHFRRERVVSSGVVQLPALPLGFERGAVLRDPDGHADALFERVPLR